jgi:multidrug transporter EmrE-like cation transporter
MSTPVVLAVLLGALLHAAWNALVKSSGDSQADLALVHLNSALAALPLLALAGLPPPAAWPFVAASLLIHVAYYITLDGAYRHGELGSTYPIMRGSAPLLVALAGAAVLGETADAAGLAGHRRGHASACCWSGCRARRPRLHHGRALAYALANAAVIAAYTLVDGQGVRATAAAGHSAIGTTCCC